MITMIQKRDGREIHFTPEKITRAIYLAANSVASQEGKEADYTTAELLTTKVIHYLESHFDATPNGEDIQDAVIKVLIEEGHAKTAEAYIL